MMQVLTDFEPLWPAEQKLADEVYTGETVRISDVLPPENASKAHRIRASFLRYLALGGCDACAPGPKGVRVFGAYIDGDLSDRQETQGLDLEGCTLAGDLGLYECRVPDLLLLRSSRLTDLFLDGSVLAQGFNADRLEAKGDVFLRRAKITGDARLLAATLGGSLDCDEATLLATETGIALYADGLNTHGDVFLRETTVVGSVRLPGAKLGGNLDCDAASLQAGENGNALHADGLDVKGDVFLRQTKIVGAVRLLGASLGGNLEFDGASLTAGDSGVALDADSLVAKGLLIIRDGTSFKGETILSSARVGGLADDLECWPRDTGALILDGFRYDRIASGSTVASKRLAWLAKQDPSAFGEDFWPQPYEQLASVLRDMGHRDQATKVLIEKERLQRASKRKGTYLRPVLWLRDLLLRATVAYGHSPLRAVMWLVLFWALGAGVFWTAEQRGDVKPNQPVILRSQEWTGCFQPVHMKKLGLGQSQYACFLSRSEAQSYPRFNPWIYSADTLLPVVDLEIQRYWIPDERQAFGKWARWYLWVQIAVGWALSLLAVAGFSGLIKSD